MMTLSEASALDTPIGALTIGALAKQCGVTIRTLRYYEELSLIAPSGRTQGQYRLYHPRITQRVHAILALQSLHYSLEEILAMLGPYLTNPCDNRQQRLDQSKLSLQQQQQCLQDKLKQLQVLLGDVNARIQVLEDYCGPCAQDTSHQGDCEENCAYRNVHV